MLKRDDEMAGEDKHAELSGKAMRNIASIDEKHGGSDESDEQQILDMIAEGCPNTQGD